MYYDGLREGLRGATQVRLESWISRDTHEVVLEIMRYEQSLWTNKVAEIAIVQGHPHVMRYIHGEACKTGDKFVDEILEGVDWDEFFPTIFGEPDQTNYIRMKFTEGLVTAEEARALLFKEE